MATRYHGNHPKLLTDRRAVIGKTVAACVGTHSGLLFVFGDGTFIHVEGESDGDQNYATLGDHYGVAELLRLGGDKVMSLGLVTEEDVAAFRKEQAVRAEGRERAEYDRLRAKFAALEGS